MQSELGGEDTLVRFSLDDVELKHGKNNIRLVGEVYFFLLMGIENRVPWELYR
jgi:hypothetical protein